MSVCCALGSECSGVLKCRSVVHEEVSVVKCYSMNVDSFQGNRQDHKILHSII